MSRYYKPKSSKRKYNGPTSSSFDFEGAVKEILAGYQASVLPVMDDVCVDVAKDAVRKLRSVSDPRDTGEYAKGWAYKKESGRLTVTTIVYGKHGTYQLAHLLENGHVTRNGTGRTYDPTPAHPHIKSVADWCQEEAPKRMKQKLENISV